MILLLMFSYAGFYYTLAAFKTCKQDCTGGKESKALEMSYTNAPAISNLCQSTGFIKTVSEVINSC